MKIAIAAGHDPKRRGACYDGVCEHELAIGWQMAILANLGAHGRAVPPNMALREKIRWINAYPDTSLAVEIHFNAAGTTKATGCETLYMPGSSKGRRAAEIVQNAISSLCAPNRGVKEGWYRMDRPGQVDYKGDVEGDEIVDAFLRQTKAPAIIIEPFFIHELSRIEVMREPVCAVIAGALIKAAKGETL